MALGFNTYGKSLVQISKIRRDDPHTFDQLEVDTRLEGDFAGTHITGDNSTVIPTDTQKNTVHALGAINDINPIESFGLVLVKHFLEFEQVSSASIAIRQHPWHRIGDHTGAFVHGGSERRTTFVEHDGKDIQVTSGLSDLSVLKTSMSEFAGYPKTEFTILPETHDRIFATSITATWRYNDLDIDFNATFDRVRNTLLDVFGGHHSLSVQHTLFAMGEAVLAENPSIVDINIIMPNDHHLPVDQSAWGGENKNEVFMPVSSPSGYIEATVVR